MRNTSKSASRTCTPTWQRKQGLLGQKQRQPSLRPCSSLGLVRDIPIKTLFKREFPEVWQFIEGVKKKDYKKLARLLQRTEAQFMIYTVCERIRRESPDTFVATIHDSILHLPRDSEYIRAVLEGEFAKWGLKPRLEIKNYAVIDLTETAEYRCKMEEAIEANREWFDELGYADADFELKAWMIWHRCGHDSRDGGTKKCSLG